MKPIIRIPLAIVVTSAVISLGVIGVHASSDCVRFIQKKVRHHHVSAATAARWVAWDKAHPNWHPKTPKETMAALDFACSVPLIQNSVDGQLPPVEIGTFGFAVDMLPPPTPPVVVAMSAPPPQLFPDTTNSLVSPPIYSPEYPSIFGALPPVTPHVTPPGLTPEPSTWMLLATAVFGIASLGYRRRLRPATVVARR